FFRQAVEAVVGQLRPGDARHFDRAEGVYLGHFEPAGFAGSAQHGDVEGGVVRGDDLPVEQAEELGVKIGKGGRLAHGAFGDAVNIAAVALKAHVRVDEGIAPFDDGALPHDGNAQGAGAVAAAVGGLKIDSNKIHPSLPRATLYHRKTART